MVYSKGDLGRVTSCWISTKTGLVNFTAVEPDKAQPKKGRRMVKVKEADTESGDNGFRSGGSSPKFCFETWREGFIVSCHSRNSAGKPSSSRKLLLLSSLTGSLSSLALTIAGQHEVQLTYLAGTCLQYLLVVCVP